MNEPFYSNHTRLAPLFLKEDAEALRNFLENQIQIGDEGEIIDRIETSELKPSKQLSESIAAMLRGNPEFTMIDEQKIVFEEALFLSEEVKKSGKSVLIVAGYCWEWKSKKDPRAFDIVFPEFNFRMKWNLTEDGSLWIMKPESIEQIGCIHTCQGLELEYVGVIIGNDLQLDGDGKVITDPKRRAKQDNTIKGYKTLLKNHPIEGWQKIDRIIKNTYRTLMTRGMKGCYVYATDENLREYLKSAKILF